MAAGGRGNEEHAQMEPGRKGKKNSNATASFFTPLSKKTKVAKVVVEPGKNVDVVEERKNHEFQESPATSAAVFDKKKPSKKKAKVVQDQRSDVENVSPLLDAQLGGIQPDVSLEQTEDKTNPKVSPAKRKRKAQQNMIESKPVIGLHGPDLFLQARLAAEENARLSAGKATHPFFARPKAGGARSLVTDEAAHSMSGRSLNPALDRAEQKYLRMSPSKPPHPFFTRQHVASMKALTVEESPSSYESDSLAPCLPLHITQNMPEEDANLAWFPDWTRRNYPVESDDGKNEGNWSFASYQPSYTWTWPSSRKRKRKGQPISRGAAFGRVIEYLMGKEASARYLLGEEVDSVAAATQKLVEKFSSYYYPSALKDHFEQNSASQPSTERQAKVNSVRNPLWTDQYQPPTSQEVCGNNECVKTLSSWLQNWREQILQQRRAVKNNDEAESSSSDDDSDFEDSPSEISDNNDLCNCLLVAGPVGCGKSATVYACAMEQGFTIIEVNASECRSGALIKHKFKEAMESHGLSKRRSSAPADASDRQLDLEKMSKLGESCQRSILFNEGPENQLSLSQSANESNRTPSTLRGLRVILFEDVDIVFEEDSGFMGALALLARTSKCPIIFTSNSQKPVLPQLTGLQVLRFEPPSTAELVAHAHMVCMAEGVSCSPYIVEHIVKTSGHDLRKLLMLLQFWTQGSPTDNNYLDGACAVENTKVPYPDKQNPNLVTCLLQLDGCPQVPATRIHAADKKHSNEELNTSETCDEQEPRKYMKKLDSSSCQRPVYSKNSKRRSLDSDWLYAHDCQHRVLPLLVPKTEPCQLIATVASNLEIARKEVMALTDSEVAQWSRHRFDKLKNKEEAESQARKALRKLQAAGRKEMNGKPSEGFSFLKLMRSSYDSPAAQTASNECTKDSLYLLQAHERSSSEEREGDFAAAREDDGHERHLSGVITDVLTTYVDKECVNLLPVSFMNSRSSSETGSTILGDNCTPGLLSDLSISDPIDLGGQSSQQIAILSDATAKTVSQIVVDTVAPFGFGGLNVHKPLTLGDLDPSPLPTDSLTIHHDVGTQFIVAEQPCNQGENFEDKILNLASLKMEQFWSQLRRLPLRNPIIPELDTNILFEAILQDLSACDFLSSRVASASKVSMEQNGEYDDCTEDSSWDNCLESAAVLAQLRLNQALNNFLPPNSLHLDTWQVGPSVSQQDASRGEKQASEDERVDSLLPQRCRLSGRLTRLDYISFHSQLTAAYESQIGTGRARRQRKLTEF